MSREYQQVHEHSWCTDHAYRAIEVTKGPDSLSLLMAVLLQEGSVVQEAFVRIGLDPVALRNELKARKKQLGDALEAETWIVDKATRRAKAEGFPLATDHLLEVIWDEDCEGSRWLSERIDPEQLEEALNSARYPDEDDDPGLDVPWGHGPGSGPRETPPPLEHPRSH